MRKSAVVAVALIGVAALSGSAALSVSATTDGKAHTLRMVARSTADHSTGRNSVVGTDVVRSHGTIVGYDSYTQGLTPHNTPVAQIALALKGGIIVYRVSLTGGGPRFDGPILYGTGAYRGIEGTATGRATPTVKTFITLHYHL